MPEIVVFGPQRLQPILRPELERLGAEGPVASITAGWQEREGETGEMAEHLEREVRELGLHQRSGEVFDEDPDLFSAHRTRQDRLQALQHLYRMRLDFVLEPARRLLGRTGDPALLEPERESAIEAIRRLDREHLARVAEVHEEYEAEWRPTERDSVLRHRRELEEILGNCGAVAIAGGHVAVLLNRLRLFGIRELLDELLQESGGDRPVLAWSAGAMALSERIVLFHDSPPQGAGNAEVLDLGLGLFRGLVPLPHAGVRLRLDDPIRVSLFARRFAPDACVPLDAETSVRWSDGEWHEGRATTVLRTSGRVEPWSERERAA